MRDFHGEKNDMIGGYEHVDKSIDFRFQGYVRVDITTDSDVEDMSYTVGTEDYGKSMDILLGKVGDNRRFGWVRLRVKLSDGSFSLLVRKFNFYINALHNGKFLYEIGLAVNKTKFFNTIYFTEYRVDYKSLLGVAGRGNLSGLELGHQPLINSADRIIRNLRLPIRWKRSIAIFSMMFPESGRFVWIKRHLTLVMARFETITIHGDYEYMGILPKDWSIICRVARRKKPCRNEDKAPLIQPNQCSVAGCKALLKNRRYARAAIGLGTLDRNLPRDGQDDGWGWLPGEDGDGYGDRDEDGDEDGDGGGGAGTTGLSGGQQHKNSSYSAGSRGYGRGSSGSATHTQTRGRCQDGQWKKKKANGCHLDSVTLDKCHNTNILINARLQGVTIESMKNESWSVAEQDLQNCSRKFHRSSQHKNWSVYRKKKVRKKFLGGWRRQEILSLPRVKDKYASSVAGKSHSFSTDYMSKLLGLDVCSETVVGKDMLRGISGGQRVTTGEMVVGPRKTLFMDEISTGLDSSTTFQIVKCIKNQMETTVLMALLQSAPETFYLFDDLILLSKGHMVFQGPREEVLKFFESLGFQKPLRKGTADFFQEVTSRKDQEQYWADSSKPYESVDVSKISEAYENSIYGRSLKSSLSVACDKSKSQVSALRKRQYGVSKWKILQAVFSREFLLIKRHSFLYIFKMIQVAFVGFVTCTLFLRTRLHPTDLVDGSLYLVGDSVLQFHHLPNDDYWYWLGVGVLLAYAWVFNIVVTLTLAYLNHGNQATPAKTDTCSKKHGWTLPFKPLSMAFHNVNYYVGMPKDMDLEAVSERGLVFLPGVLTALMGLSGAGKTTLLDVLAGRKTGGYIEGDISISVFKKAQSTFARIAGYVEQNDIHSPQVTVIESLLFSAFFRLPADVSEKQKRDFVEGVIKLVELDNLRDALVGLPGCTGLSTEQRKRLTIAVELVANPSIIFMDEPTSGLEARAAAIVMRTVRNTVDTGRTVVCTIHQPSIEIFEAFDELLLLQRGGSVIYGGKVGERSDILIKYFESINGITKILSEYYPANWMLEMTTPAVEERIGQDFAVIYKNSKQYRDIEAVIQQASTPEPDSESLHLSQFKICSWKQNLVYWRSPGYNAVRLLFFTTICALIVGSVFRDVGSKRYFLVFKLEFKSDFWGSV